jgi:tungstate transport system substrate-binding protein
LSPTAKKLLTAVLACGVAAAAVAGINIARSVRSITAARTPGAQIRGSPLTRPAAPATGRHVRVVVIGGMTFTGFWGDLAKRYETETGVRVDLIATGEKNDIADVFRKGGVDLVTMHASDTVINLVADGYAVDPQPWMRNDQVVVGPPDDPAKIRGMTDVAAALKKIADSKSSFVVGSSLGSQEVLVNILGPNQIIFTPDQVITLFGDHDRSLLTTASAKHAYTIVGRIPFRTGRIPNAGLELMVRDDPRLRRPFVAAVANPARVPQANYHDAKQFAKWLRDPATQQWIAGYGRGLVDDDPLFFPVTVDGAAAPSE